MPYRHNGEDHFKGHGWTRKRAEGWERAFGSRPLSEQTKRTISDAVRIAEKLIEENDDRPVSSK